MRILVISDDGVPTGFGRISMEVNKRLRARGVDIIAVSLAYDGLLPPMLNNEAVPYHVGSLQGKPWHEAATAVTNVIKPDVIMVIQDAPYLMTMRGAPLDWSVIKFVGITPVDGAPIHGAWVEVMKKADAALTISQFGVDTFKQQGVRAALCRPAADLNVFYPLPDEQKRAIRAKLGIADGAFVLGTVAMNQGRKQYPAMLEGFFKFAQDKPTARYILDCDKVSAAGWDIPEMCRMFGWDATRLLFKEDCVRAGVESLNERYNAMDAHVVLSHREGFGLPLVESQCAGVVAMAMDYCSGPEICGEGRGVLVKPAALKTVSTWGNALDLFADGDDYVAQLERLYASPDERRAIAQVGMKEARSHTWDHAADAVWTALTA